MDEELEYRLTAARVASSPNQISPSDLRTWVIEYLDEYDDEISRFPHLSGEPHWNLWMMDARIEDAIFAAVVFRPEGAEFVCGTGDAYAIRNFAESEFPSNPDQLAVELTARFTVPLNSLRICRQDLEAWIGRPWQHCAG